MSGGAQFLWALVKMQRRLRVRIGEKRAKSAPKGKCTLESMHQDMLRRLQVA